MYVFLYRLMHRLGIRWEHLEKFSITRAFGNFLVLRVYGRRCEWCGKWTTSCPDYLHDGTRIPALCPACEHHIRGWDEV